MHSIILDLETLSREPTAIITEIGLIVFDRVTFKRHSAFSIAPLILEQLAIGRHFDRDTYQFHLKHASLPTTSGKESIGDTCEIIKNIFLSTKPQHVWIQGPDFDRPILENFLTQAGHKLPWDYWRTRDVRTAWDLAFPGEQHPPRPHHALPDCEATLACLQKALEKLKH
jgi:hypothetical protein